MTKPKELRDEHIVGYLVSLFLKETILRHLYHGGSPEDRARVPSYDEDIAEMQRDGVLETGHLSEANSLITWLTDLHLQLLRSPKFPYYSAAYYKALPFIVELRAKGAPHDQPEVETAVTALFEVSMMQMAKREVSEATRKATTVMGEWLDMLAEYYKQEKAGTLELE